MKNTKKKVITAWNLEDCDCNHSVFINIEDAFDAAVDRIKESSLDIDEKMQMCIDLATSLIKRDSSGSKGFYIDEFLWCYPVDLMLDEYKDPSSTELSFDD